MRFVTIDTSLFANGQVPVFDETTNRFGAGDGGSSSGSGSGSGESTSPGGSNNDIQINNAGAFGGSGALTFDGSTLNVTGAIAATGNVTGANLSGTNTGDQDLSGYELLSHKATSFTTLNNTLYPTTQAVQTAINAAVVGLFDNRGPYDASGNSYPSTGGSGAAGAILKSDTWICSVAGTLGGAAVSAGELIIALVDTPGSTSANWGIVENNLGYTPEDAANKDTDSAMAANSDTKYPSQKAVKTALALKAPLASPALTGTPTAPTATMGTNTTQIATTAFVLANATGGSGSGGGVFSAIASEAEAEAGTDNTKGMTPLRTAQAIAALATGGSGSGVGGGGTITQTQLLNAAWFYGI